MYLLIVLFLGVDRAAYVREQDLLMLLENGDKAVTDKEQANVEQEGVLIGGEDAIPGPSQTGAGVRTEVVEEDAEYALHLSPTEEDILHYDYSSDEQPEVVRSSFSSKDGQYSGICSITIDSQVVCIPLGVCIEVTSAGRKGGEVEGAGSGKQVQPSSDKTRKLVKDRPCMDVEGMQTFLSLICL